jgi:hypothetical protein
MKRVTILASILMLLACGGCGGDSPDKVANDSIGVMEEMATILEGVKDEASAKKANDKLRALGDKMKEIKARQDKLAMTAQQKAEMQKKHEDKMRPVLERVIKEGMRISFDPNLKPALDGLEASMQGL